jgi:UDP-N-acetylmuramate: L-alanyl-gamma-D-glutamyl-meso-diaminopimelate ligase
VLDDFAHHPTAIEATLRTVRRRHGAARVWAVLEPRSWSLRRNVFQHTLAEAFDAADEVVIADVYRAQDVPPAKRLDPRQLVADLRRRGRSARFAGGAGAIVSELEAAVGPGDVVVVMSNGGFDGLPDRLLTALARRLEPAPGEGPGVRDPRR